MKDYRVEYSGPDGFDLGRLLHDDHFDAIRILYERERYVSAAKLLVSTIDTLAHLSFGDIARGFQQWLDTYVDLKPVGISSDELWEFRNSLLHATNAESRKVRLGRTLALHFYVGDLPGGRPEPLDRVKLFELRSLVRAVADGIDELVSACAASPDFLVELLERYELIISDVRYDVFHVPETDETA